MTLIIGKGRTGRHFQRYLELLDTPVSSWSRSTHTLEDLPKSVKAADRIILAISDSAILGFFHEILLPLLQPGQKVIHLSGSVVIPEVPGFHPLMTFGDELYDLATYERVHFVSSSEQNIHDVFPSWKNTSSNLIPRHMAFYHSLCVSAGNIPAFMIVTALRQFIKLGIPESAIENFVHQTVTNAFRKKEASFTGPAIRGDLNVCQKHLTALKEKDTELETIYRSYVETLHPDWKKELP